MCILVKAPAHACQSNGLLESLRLPIGGIRVVTAIPFEPFKDWPVHSAASRNAALKSTSRACIHKSSKLQECLCESAKSPHKPALSPVRQILNEFPGAPLIRRHTNDSPRVSHLGKGMQPVPRHAHVTVALCDSRRSLRHLRVID